MTVTQLIILRIILQAKAENFDAKLKYYILVMNTDSLVSYVSNTCLQLRKETACVTKMTLMT